MARLKGLLRHPGARYVFVGGSVYFLELVVIVVAQRYYHTSGVVAVGLSFWIGLIVSFCLQKLVTFEDKRLHHRILFAQIVAFSLLVLWNFSFTVLVTKILANTVPAAVARTLALLVTTIWNFYLYKTRIFKTLPEPAEKIVY